MQAVFWNLSSHASSLFSLGWVGSDGESLCLAKKKLFQSYNRENRRFKKNEVKWIRQFKDEGNRSLLQSIDWFQCVICQKETTENSQCPVNWKPHYSCMCWIPYFWTRLNFILWDGKIKFSSWLQRRWNSASTLSSRLLCGKNLVAMRSRGPNRIAWW